MQSEISFLSYPEEQTRALLAVFDLRAPHDFHAVVLAQAQQRQPAIPQTLASSALWEPVLQPHMPVGVAGAD